MTSQEQWRDAERDAVHEAAAEWFTRLQDPQLSVAQTAAWQEWMTAQPQHAEAFRRIEEVWQAASNIDMTGSTDAKDYDPSIPVSEWFERRSAQRKVRWRAAAAAMVILAVTGSVPFWLASRGERLVTPVGQNRAVRLTDGSRVELGGDTEVRVHLNRTSRRLELVRGEAFFSVARDATRPFEVRAGKTRVTAVGTAFNVRRGAERIVVAVLEGRVTIAGAERRAPMPVDAGEQTIVIRSSVTAAVPIANAQSATAWQSGRLSFDHEPLRYVLEDVNRYAPKPIVIDDPAVENLQISGTVLSDNVPGWIRSIVSAFELEVTETEDAIVLRQAR